MPEARQVQAMFGRIAPRYDVLNRLLSAGIDQGWRRRLLREAGDVRGKHVVDVACGTGDLSLLFASAGARVVGVDFTGPMLTRAEHKSARGRAAGTSSTLFVQGDALRMPLATGVADVATIAFGIRNVEDRQRGFEELARVVRPGGRVFVLEFSMPPGKLLGGVYRTYFTRVLPRIGAAISGDRAAYEYLPETVLAWPSPAELEVEMGSAGLVDCGHALLTGGVACLSYGTVGPRSTGDPAPESSRA